MTLLPIVLVTTLTSCLVFANNLTQENIPIEIFRNDEFTFEEFDWRLVKTLALEDKGNEVLSPISIKVVLAMLHESALGKTKEELRKVLGLSHDKLENRARFRKVLNELQHTGEGYSLDMGTRLFVSSDSPPHLWFSRVAMNAYDASLQPVEFDEPTTAAYQINEWVQHATHQRIKKLIEDESVLTDAQMVMVNALYFSADWQIPFEAESTRPGEFKTRQGHNVSALYMSNNDFYFYSHVPELKAEILRMPYAGDRYSMLFILPDVSEEIDKFIANLDPLKISNYIQTLEYVNAYVKIPKFKFNYALDLKNILKKLGVKTVFGNDAELSGFARPVKLSEMFQKSGIEVNENGTTAFAATAGILTDRISSGYVPRFVANRPFLYFIEEEKSGTIVFVGKIEDPTVTYNSVGGSVKVPVKETPATEKQTEAPTTTVKSTSPTTAAPAKTTTKSSTTSKKT